MLMLAGWAQSIVTFHPEQAAAFIAGVHIVYKLHVFSISIVLVFPFTRLVHHQRARVVPGAQLPVGPP